MGEVKEAEPRLVQEIEKRFMSLLDERRFIEAVSGHMSPDETSQARVKLIINTIKELAGGK